eukprot:Opistho-2@49985
MAQLLLTDTLRTLLTTSLSLYGTSLSKDVVREINEVIRNADALIVADDDDAGADPSGVAAMEDVVVDKPNTQEGNTEDDALELPRPVVPFGLLRRLQDALRSTPGAFFLHEATAGSEIVVSQPPKRPRNPELIARLIRLRAQQQEREYMSMVRSVAPESASEGIRGSKTDVRMMNDALSIAFGMIFTMVGVFAATYHVSYYAFQKDNALTAKRVLFGIACAVVAVFAELYFVLRKENAIEDADERAKKRTLPAVRFIWSSRRSQCGVVRAIPFGVNVGAVAVGIVSVGRRR